MVPDSAWCIKISIAAAAAQANACKMEDSSAARKTGHRPYLMPDGSRLTSYLGDAAAEHKPRKAKKGGRKSGTDRGGTHGVRVLSGPGAQESREEV